MRARRNVQGNRVPQDMDEHRVPQDMDGHIHRNIKHADKKPIGLIVHVSLSHA